MNIALLEDDHYLAEDVVQLLRKAGHEVTHYADGHLIIRGLARDTFDLFVLDWHVPGPSGMKVLHHIRKDLKLNTPVMFLTSKNAEFEIVAAFNAGADDYCSKPIKEKEFSARIAALQRRFTPVSREASSGELIPGYEFNRAEHTFFVNGKAADLTEKEFDLAMLFFKNPDRPLARNRIMLEVWGREEDALSRTLDVHVSWIRRKLAIGTDAVSAKLVVVHGFGYRLVLLNGPINKVT